jgi:hypothetical protein
MLFGRGCVKNEAGLGNNKEGICVMNGFMRLAFQKRDDQG